jgi:hypothetical protein
MRRPSRLTIAMAASTVFMAGAGGTTAALLWPASAAAGPSSGQSAAGQAAARLASLSSLGSSSFSQPETEAASAQQLRLSQLHAQHTILARQARRAAARRAARRRAARLAAEQAAARRAAQQQAAQQAAQPAQPAAAVPAGSAQHIAMGMLGSFGWSSSQFSCLDPLWSHESGWSVTAENPSSGAYGIPQALPGSKMASAGPDWQSSAATQIRWGLGYIKEHYGSPCAAWEHEQSVGWY